MLELARRRAEPYRRRLLGRPGMNERVMDDHQQIIEAIESGDRVAGGAGGPSSHPPHACVPSAAMVSSPSRTRLEEIEMIQRLDNATALLNRLLEV